MFSWLARLFRRDPRGQDPPPAGETKIACSRCYQVASLSASRVIPWFNASLGDYVTTYRCGDCWRPSLQETRARVPTLASDEREWTSFSEFFARHGVDLKDLLGQTPGRSRPDLASRILDAIESGAVRLNP